MTKITLRDYQQEAVDITIATTRQTLSPFLVELPTGAGKSLYLAAVAIKLHELSGKRILILAPRAELVLQNREKVQLLGAKGSVYSSSAGEKSLRHPIIAATPGTFKSQAKRMGEQFAAVLIDECDSTTPTIREIIDTMRQCSPNLRVIGTTGTPYTMNGGYIYRIDEQGKALSDYHTRDPYYERLVYKLTTRQLLDRGFLTPVKVGDTGMEHYGTIHLKPNRMGRFSSTDINEVFVGRGGKTAMIVHDAVNRMDGRHSIVFFAATVRHAEEILSSLNPNFAAVVHGETPNRDAVLRRFVNGELRFLVNVDVLTVGWDCPRVDGIVMMRATESARLLQQIIGRGLRLYDGKEDVLLLDYAQNLERHAPHGDIFAPEIRAKYRDGELEDIECKCPVCDGINIFSARPNSEGYSVNEHGYFLDLAGFPVETDAGEPMPAHFGRRCQQSDIRGNRCDYYWTSKECPVCGHYNDITARYCENCKHELISPDEKLILAYQEAKKDPTIEQTERVVEMSRTRGVSRAGNEMVTVNFVTESRAFSVYLVTVNQRAEREFQFVERATMGFNSPPETITYKKDGSFWRIIAFNRPTDQEILQEKLNEVRTDRAHRASHASAVA